MTDAPPAIQLILPATDTAALAANGEPDAGLLDVAEPGERETLVDLDGGNLLWGLVVKSKNLVLSIIGDDDRRPVHDNSIAPWSGLSLVRVTDRSGAVRTGTAF